MTHSCWRWVVVIVVGSGLLVALAHLDWVAR